MIFDPRYFLFLSPALLLAAWAQWRVRSAYAAGMQEPSQLSGAEAARRMLDASGLRDVNIEEIEGQLTDHYDPREKVLRLSSDVYRSHTLAAVGIACHEAGHALQDATHYSMMGIRNLAVPAANFGSSAGLILFMIGLFLRQPVLAMIGLAGFAMVAVFQLVNLPVEFDASNRAKRQLVELGMINQDERGTVRRVLNAAGWTYVAATLQSILTVLYYAQFLGGGSRDRD